MSMFRRPMSGGGGGGNPYTRSPMANPPQSGGMYGGSTPQPRGGGDMAPQPGGLTPTPDQQQKMDWMQTQFNQNKSGGSYERINQLMMQLQRAQAMGAPPSVIQGLQMQIQLAQQDFQRQTQMNQAMYGARGGDNPYVAQLIGLGMSPGQAQGSVGRWANSPSLGQR